MLWFGCSFFLLFFLTPSLPLSIVNIRRTTAMREGGSSSADALKAEKEKSKAEEKKKRLDSRNRLAARAAMFESKGC